MDVMVDYQCEPWQCGNPTTHDYMLHLCDNIPLNGQETIYFSLFDPHSAMVYGIWTKRLSKNILWCPKQALSQ